MPLLILLLMLTVEIPIEKSLILFGGERMMMISFDKTERKTFGFKGLSPKWSPDCRKIAFSNRDIFLMDKEGNILKQLTNDQWSTSPAWHPDGRRIAFVSLKGRKGDIYEVDVETGRITRLTFTQEDEFSPNWLPDGRRILCSGGKGFAKRLYLIDLAQGKIEDVTPEGLDCRQPDLSPDGKLVAFVGFSKQARYSVFVMDLGTRRARRVTDKELCWDPLFSPDGKMVMYRVGNVVWVKDLDSGREWKFLEGEFSPSSWRYPHYRYDVSPKLKLLSMLGLLKLTIGGSL